MSLSLHQIAAYREFSDRLDRIARATSLNDTVIGTRGGETDVKKLMKELTRNG
jgi:hypothetical protein